MPRSRVLPGRIAYIVMLLVKQPRTVREISALTYMDKAAVRRYLNAFVEEGLVRKRAIPRSSPEYLYSWEPERYTII
jgi:predicted transcriptional regulator